MSHAQENQDWQLPMSWKGLLVMHLLLLSLKQKHRLRESQAEVL